MTGAVMGLPEMVWSGGLRVSEDVESAECRLRGVRG